MLQQTQVKTEIPYFNNFVKKVPSLKALSKSKEKKILKLWEGLGYYKRAKNLLKTSKILIKKYNGKIPNNFLKLKELPGIGDYTANVLLALTYIQPRIGIDANVKRVISRLNIINTIEDSLSLFKTKRNADLAEALMEFGALVCKPKEPICDECNIRKMCAYYVSESKIKFSKKIKMQTKNYDIFAEDIRLALNEISKIYGNFDVENILDIIFSDFCIGK